VGGPGAIELSAE